MTNRRPARCGGDAAGELCDDFRQVTVRHFARRAARAFAGRVSVLPNAAVRSQCRRLSALDDGPVRLTIERVSDRATVYALSCGGRPVEYVAVLTYDATTTTYTTRSALEADIADCVV